MENDTTKRNIRLLNLAAALLWLSMYSYVPILSAYASSIGASVVTIGLLGGVYGLLQIILRIPLGLLYDRVGKDRLVLSIGFVVLCVANLLFVTLGHSVGWLLFARLLAGAAASWWVVLSASYSHLHPPHLQVRSQGVLSAAANGGKVVASLLCAVLAMLFGYASTFAAALVTSIAGLVLVLQISDAPRPKKSPKRMRDQLKLFGNKEFLLFCILASISQFLCFAVPTTFTQLLAKEQMAASSFDLGMLTLVFFLATAISSLFSGTKLYNKVGGIPTVVLAFLIGALACVPIFYQLNLPLLYLMQVLAGICYGITQAVLAGFAMLSVPQNERGAAMGIFQSLYGVGILLGPIFLGFVIDASSFGTAYWVMVAIMAATALCSRLLIPKKYNHSE